MVFLIKKTKEIGRMTAQKEVIDRASSTNEKFYRFPIIEITANPCPKKKPFPFGTKIENHSQAYGMGLLIFSLIEITFYVCSPTIRDNGHVKSPLWRPITVR